MDPNPFVETHVAPEQETPQRLPDYAIGVFQRAPTKSALKKAIKKQRITVNGEVASTATYIRGGETIELQLPEYATQGRKLVFPLEVLYEDEYMAAVHKPAGILVSGNSFKTIARALPQNLKRSSLPDAIAPQPVHRLDYATTGVLLVGKTSGSIRALNQLFADRSIAKIYYAITIGSMQELGVLQSMVDDKPSESVYSVLDSVPSERFGMLNLVDLKPATGRRHQLRQQLASIGTPILGDRDYGQEPLILRGKGMYLHAYSIFFVHPFTGKSILLEDEAIQRFEKIFPAMKSRIAQ